MGYERIFGQIGDGTNTNHNPVQVKNGDGTELGGVVEICADYSHTVFLKNDCTVWARLSNNGQLGDGTNLQRLYPVEVKNSDGTGFTGGWDYSGHYHSFF